MKILCLLSLILAVILPILAQFPSESIVVTSNACINDCLRERSLIFAADNLRNFRKIILHIEEFCDTRDELLKCAQLCTNEEQEELAPKTMISTYICKDKLEEFRLVKECMERQDDDGINKCISECDYPFDATIQLDSSPAALVNPSSLTDNTTEVCRMVECAVKCSIRESNKICAGSGYLLRDMGLKQVVEASKELQNIAFNSTSANQQLTQLYLETLPHQCTFLINPINYNMTFGDEESDNSKIRDDDAGEGTMKPSSTMDEEINEMTVEIIHTNGDNIMTRLFATEFTTESTTPSEDDIAMKEPISSEGVMEGEDEGEKSTTSIDDKSKDMEDDKEEATAETDHEGEQESEDKQEEKEEEDEEMDNRTKEKSEEEMKSSEEMMDQLSTTERTIVVVNDDDKDNGIDTNTILQQGIEDNKNRTSQATRERITLSLLIILPISSLYFSN